MTPPLLAKVILIGRNCIPFSIQLFHGAGLKIAGYSGGSFSCNTIASYLSIGVKAVVSLVFWAYVAEEDFYPIQNRFAGDNIEHKLTILSNAKTSVTVDESHDVSPNQAVVCQVWWCQVVGFPRANVEYALTVLCPFIEASELNGHLLTLSYVPYVAIELNIPLEPLEEYLVPFLEVYSKRWIGVASLVFDSDTSICGNEAGPIARYLSRSAKEIEVMRVTDNWSPDLQSPRDEVVSNSFWTEASSFGYRRSVMALLMK